MGKIGPAVLVTITTYLALVFLFGPRGLLAYHHRAQYRELLERNLQRLTERRDELLDEITRLQEDPAAIVIAAREQHLLDAGEWLIRIRDPSGSTLLPPPRFSAGISPGSVLRRQAAFPDYSPIFRGVAASAGIAAYLFALGLGSNAAPPAGPRTRGKIRSERGSAGVPERGAGPAKARVPRRNYSSRVQTAGRE